MTSSAKTATAPSAADIARARIKTTALRLFCAQGVDGVSVRDIVSAAQMKNNASLHYYFGSKEALVRELVIDCAQRSDDARIQGLKLLESRGGPSSIRDIVQLLIDSETSLIAQESDRLGTSYGHMRFIMALQINHREVLLEALEGGRRHARGYMRCIAYLRKFMQPLPHRAIEQRIYLMYIYITSAMAAREAELETAPAGQGYWGTPAAIEALVLTTCGLLESAPPRKA